MFERFTNRAQEVIGEAKKAASQLEQNYIGTEHLLLGLVRVSDSVASKLLQEQGVTEERLEELISSLITPTASVSVREPDGFSPEAYRVIQNSYLEAKRFHSSLVGTEHILISMLKSFDCAGTKLLNTMKVNIRQLYIELVSAKDGDVAAAREDVESLQYTRNAESKTPLLDQYSTDLTELAKEGRIDPVIGREQEINRVIQILSRRTKNNPCLIGEPGGVYETPGGAILYKAINVLETITLDKESAHLKEQLAQKYADIVYNGQWFTPLREALDAFANSLAKTVTGDVKLKLYKGNMINAGVTSPFTLYDEQTASFGEDEDYNQADAAGFINLFGLSIKERAKLSKSWPKIED